MLKKLVLLLQNIWGGVKPNHRKAFTLAEVLITLGIIGVVAAMTIPNLIANTQKRQTIVKLKKVYSTLNNAYRLSSNEMGDSMAWNFDLSAKDVWIEYMAPFVTGTICTTNTGGCAKYKNSRCVGCAYSYQMTPAVILQDGTYIMLAKDNGLLIQVDLNGPAKPNTYGKDIFNLQIHNLDQKQCKYTERFGFFCQWCGACQHAGGQRNRSHFKGTCTKTNATSCGGLIQADSWDILSDYPWK